MKNYKPFSKLDYNKHDSKAKLEAKMFWESNGYNVDLQDTDSYTYDLKIFFNNTWIKVEAEHKTPWKGKSWPVYYPTVDVPYRKHKNASELYMLFNNNYDAFCLAKMRDVQSSNRHEKDTIYTINELFFNVKLKHFIFFEKINNNWIKTEDKMVNNRINKN